MWLSISCATRIMTIPSTISTTVSVAVSVAISTMASIAISTMASPFHLFPSTRISHMFHGMMDSLHHRPNGRGEFGIPDVLSERKNILDIVDNRHHRDSNRGREMFRFAVHALWEPTCFNFYTRFCAASL